MGLCVSLKAPGTQPGALGPAAPARGAACGPQGYQARRQPSGQHISTRLAKPRVSSRLLSLACVLSALGTWAPGTTMGLTTVTSREGLLCVFITSRSRSRGLSARLGNVEVEPREAGAAPQSAQHGGA